MLLSWTAVADPGMGLINYQEQIQFQETLALGNEIEEPQLVVYTVLVSGSISDCEGIQLIM